ncbi:hypothetical protein BASA50_008991 [Batrachochytrium salamandrivorans]|uniref:Nitrate reductase [NADPH] n=1 Tax=Batrachochytrium salamandrivorans TaxID=1357716 RepID=A0ABQ8F2I5_9FUNG|nr:hypothetical protein BASA62_000055 [Batrachochytrium salamandrivorans]KAH6573065.1 hypothetical protein BASA60_006233 [Batrachochytrium salamandrivorans]KAH6578423.1 hypothetical protein BASA61_000180 [Batrachochytrium salamandrivorans]KAH6590991.1 hypothetical protein BASA50_008991 [Batrachochytrium salamandrivorans]KAH9268592.1 hypothetical protein BASA84_000198 [Batrachochytrium salamandrivorans]
MVTLTHIIPSACTAARLSTRAAVNAAVCPVPPTVCRATLLQTASCSTPGLGSRLAFPLLSIQTGAKARQFLLHSPLVLDLLATNDIRALALKPPFIRSTSFKGIGCLPHRRYFSKPSGDTTVLPTTDSMPADTSQMTYWLGVGAVALAIAAVVAWRAQIYSDAPTTTQQGSLSIINQKSLAAIPATNEVPNPLTPASSSSSSVEHCAVSVSGRPRYSRAEVAAHKTPDSGIWVSYGDGVYDVSKFVEIHPGGERILLAAGHAIDPFWAVFSVHSTPETRELLESYRIGDLIPRADDPTPIDTKSASEGIESLFSNEPERHPSLQVRSGRPHNAEAHPDSLATFITPNELFFVRNHLPVPAVDAETYRLELEGPGIPDGFSLSLDDLRTKFPITSVTVTMQCAGNRRKEMHDVRPVKGLQWQGGAISNTVWTGVRLRDVLSSAGYNLPDFTEPGYAADISHVHLDGVEGYGASIPIEKAVDARGDVILAFEMNGVPIPRDHGFPVRAVVPGHVAARSVKWVGKITLADDESQSHWQQHDYKGFSPSSTLETSDYSKSVSIQELPVQSAILYPKTGDDVVIDDHGDVVVKGYAFSGGGRHIYRVDVSADNGVTWRDAELVRALDQPYGRQWAWTQWEARLPAAWVAERAKEGKVTFVCKAIDSSYNSQPETFESIYNARGVLVGAWSRVQANFRLQ